MIPRSLPVWLLAAAASIQPTLAQTSTKCNPLQGSCPADPALGKSTTIDFTSGQSSDFSESGSPQPSYDSNGVNLVVAQSGNSPTLTSNWFMMFGHVEVTMKAAKGVGIVSSMVLQSDDLDEVDFEWLGADGTQVQSNYFGKGQTTSYNRGAFHANPGNQDSFHTYTVDWTAEQVVWQIDGTTVRALTPQSAEANQYPQTPMQLKLGIWSGGDPSNPPGTIRKSITFNVVLTSLTLLRMGWWPNSILPRSLHHVHSVSQGHRLQHGNTIYVLRHHRQLAKHQKQWRHHQR